MCARTDTVFLPISEVCDGTVSLTGVRFLSSVWSLPCTVVGQWSLPCTVIGHSWLDDWLEDMNQLADQSHKIVISKINVSSAFLIALVTRIYLFLKPWITVLGNPRWSIHQNSYIRSSLPSSNNPRFWNLILLNSLNLHSLPALSFHITHCTAIILHAPHHTLKFRHDTFWKPECRGKTTV